MQDKENHSGWTHLSRSRSVTDALAGRALEAPDTLERSLKQMNTDWNDLAKTLADLTGSADSEKYLESFNRMIQFREALRTKIRQVPNPSRPILSSRILRKI